MADTETKPKQIEVTNPRGNMRILTWPSRGGKKNQLRLLPGKQMVDEATMRELAEYADATGNLRAKAHVVAEMLKSLRFDLPKAEDPADASRAERSRRRAEIESDLAAERADIQAAEEARAAAKAAKKAEAEKAKAEAEAKKNPA